MMQMRTHTCNALRLADVGKSVKIVGWMENVREVDIVGISDDHILAPFYIVCI